MKIKVFRIILVLLVAAVIVVTIFVISNPLRKSEERIRDSMLVQTPIGTSMEDVITTIENEKEWKTDWVDDDFAYRLDEDGKEYIPESKEKSIRVNIGTYRKIIIFPVHVSVYYYFDEESTLLDIEVTKNMDTL